MENICGLLFALRQRCKSIVPVEAFSCTYDDLKETLACSLKCFKEAVNVRQRMEAEQCLIDLLPAAFAMLPLEDLEVACFRIFILNIVVTLYIRRSCVFFMLVKLVLEVKPIIILLFLRLQKEKKKRLERQVKSCLLF